MYNLLWLYNFILYLSNIFFNLLSFTLINNKLTVLEIILESKLLYCVDTNGIYTSSFLGAGPSYYIKWNLIQLTIGTVNYFILFLAAVFIKWFDFRNFAPLKKSWNAFSVINDFECLLCIWLIQRFWIFHHRLLYYLLNCSLHIFIVA